MVNVPSPSRSTAAIEQTQTIRATEQDIAGTPYLMLGDNPDHPWGTQALFGRDSAGLATLTKGDSIRVACVVAGKALTDVILRRCELR